jgi:hypothetical protein
MPDLSTMDRDGCAATEAVFLHIRGTCKRVDGFNRYGFAELCFKIRTGSLAGWHSVAIEPSLLLLQNVSDRA